MSTDYNAYAIFGVRIDEDEFSIKTPHPLWGVHKFDPESGKEVTEFISKEIYPDEIIGGGDITPDMKIEAFHNRSEGAVYIGVPVAKAGGWRGPMHETIIDMKQEDKDVVAASIITKLKQYLPHLDISWKSFKLHLVLVVS